MAADFVEIGGSVKELNRLANQIIIGMANDSHCGEFTNGQLSFNINSPVNIRRVRFPPRDTIAATQSPLLLVSRADQAMFP